MPEAELPRVGVRTAVAADADQLAALNAVVQERHHREHPQLFKAPDLDASMSQFLVLLAQPDVTILVPEVGGRPAGYSYVELLTRPETAGMVNLRLLAVDGTKVGADASWSANRTLEQLDADLDAQIARVSKAMLSQAALVDAAEDARFGDERGDQLPEQLATRGGRLARLREARDRLAAERQGRLDEQQAKLDAWQARRDSGERPGRKPHGVPTEVTSGTGAKPRANSTDPQAAR